MSDLEEIRERLTAVEEDVSRLRDDAAVTRTLAAMADRDVGEVRVAVTAHTQLLSALRETQVEQGHTLRTIAETVGALTYGQAQLVEDVTHLTEGQAHLTQGQARLTDQVTHLTEGQARLTEGQARLTEGQARLVESQAQLAEAQARLVETQAGQADTLADLVGMVRRIAD